MEMTGWRLTGALLNFAVQMVFIARALLRPHRQPASRVAWIAIIAALPVIGTLAYLMLGETNMGRRLVARINEARKALPVPGKQSDDLIDAEGRYHLPPRLAPLFRVGQSASGYLPQGGNRAILMPDSNAAIDSMVRDIDAAIDHVHICFYIWLTDRNGTKIIDAVCRAASRGVTCRVMADELGSRRLIAHPAWKKMEQAGAHLVRAMPMGNMITWPLHGRMDMRNHRKIVVIDNRLTYCGSQNCADPEFRVKARFAPGSIS
ncbi:phospholipase D-like domain-containing protein [Asaia astilbis]|uniref:phospholipase D-like domain-containing protein n=1 Tax=Asaia astilbis TaxID=610244 RepID=UPI000A3E437D|nr:phospholipase D-like domain-containing protein [Asaia astilbis]